MRRGSWLMYIHHLLCFDPGLRFLHIDVAFRFYWVHQFFFSPFLSSVVKLIGACDYAFIIQVVDVEHLSPV